MGSSGSFKLNLLERCRTQAVYDGIERELLMYLTLARALGVIVLLVTTVGCQRAQLVAVEFQNRGPGDLTDVEYDYVDGVVPAGFVKSGSYKVGNVWRPQ
jgi:hypothetical protein